MAASEPVTCHCPPPTIELRWQQVIRKGDLPLYLRTASGDRCAPFAISFTLYQRRKGALQQVGPAGRHPVMADVGDFYATGIAGEGGQPGHWSIVWQWQMSQEGPVVEQRYPFTVLDAVLADDPSDLTPRKCKYGWEE